MASCLARRSQNSFSYCSNLGCFFAFFLFPFSSKDASSYGINFGIYTRYGQKKASRSNFPFIIKWWLLWVSTPLEVSKSALPVLPANPSQCVALIKRKPSLNTWRNKMDYSSLHMDISEEGFVLLIEWASPFVPRQLLSIQESSLNSFCLKCSCWALEAAALRVHVLPVSESVAELFVSWAETNGGGFVQSHTAGHVCGRAGHSAEGFTGFGSIVRQVWGIFLIS